MRLETRKLLDRSFSSVGAISIILMVTALVVIIRPIAWRGIPAIIFSATVEHRKIMFDEFKRGDKLSLEKEISMTSEARKPLYDMLTNFESEIKKLSRKERKKYKGPLRELNKLLKKLLGPSPGQPEPVLMRGRYGVTRQDKVEEKLHEILFIEEWDYSGPNGVGVKKFRPRVEEFAGTSMEKFFPYLEENIDKMLNPKMTFYWQFLTDTSLDSHMFGGIWAEMIGTIYLTIGSILFAVPMGVIAAIYLCEYAKPTISVRFIRICISTLAGVPSIVFGLFGLAFFLNTLKVSDSKSVLAGALTLSLLILPTIIRASEEAILAVPHTYKEAALSLGASKWHTIITVVLPAALPGILTGIVISMGRAAGETAPIIFTAAVSVGDPLKITEVLTEPTPALPWNIYNLCTEHEAVDEIRHVQFGMVLVLISVVLLLNLSAIILRARISKKLKG